ncbi:MAG: EFR1 family ferrodoxin [Planctomycetota bacterium]|nr:EFR1 family ferrodoxin [Planctomycetota bacterium]
MTGEDDKPMGGYARASLYYMSGTGNTFRVANWMADEAGRAGATVTTESLEQAHPPADGGEGKLVMLLSPTHGFTAPWHAIRFALRLPRGRDAHAAVVMTRAGSKIAGRRLPGLEGTGGYLLAGILAAKGYRVRGVLPVDMPSNWISFHPGFKPASVDDIVAHAAPRARAFARDVLGGRKRFGGFIGLLLGLVLLPVSVGYLLAGRFLLAKFFFANNRCNGCGQCAQCCPTATLRMIGRKNPRPYWSLSCEGCMRCMAFCPTRAIEAGWSWAVLLVYATHVPAVMFLLNRLPLPAAWAEALSAWWIVALLQYVYLLVSMVICYGFFHLMLRIPAVNWLFTVTTPTHVYRRYHEPGTKLADLPPGRRKTASED